MRSACATLRGLLQAALTGSSRLLRGGFRFRPAGSGPVLILGAGAAGGGVVRDLLENPGVGWSPEGYLDDDPGRRGLRIHGVPVLGTIDDIARVARSRQVREVIIAIPSADRRAMRRIVERCREAVVTMKVVPGLEALLRGRARGEPGNLPVREVPGTATDPVDAYVGLRRPDGSFLSLARARAPSGSHSGRRVPRPRRCSAPRR